MEDIKSALIQLKKYILIVILSFSGISQASAQRVPDEIENIDFLVTFGRQADKSWGDDDFIQLFFFIVPESQKDPIYIRVFDPDTGGEHDEQKGEWNTTVKYSVFGGKEAYSHPDARGIHAEGNFKSGVLLSSKIFGNNPDYDNQWYTFGPFNPIEGEYSPEQGGFIFKIICEGMSGDDGNLYRYFMSVKPGENKPVEGANAFTYKYTLRLPNDPKTVSHIYPFVGNNVVAIVQHNYDFDNDGEILIYSISKNRHKAKTGGDLEWASSKHIITPEEQNTTIDIQIIKGASKNNNIVMYITNEYNQPVPFYSNPIGGPPKYKYKVNLNYYKK